MKKLLLLDILKQELSFETKALRKMLERIPFDKINWKPHSKSMDMKGLAIHLAELPSWVTLGLETSELDLGAGPYEPPVVQSVGDLLAILDKSAKKAGESLESASEEDLLPGWTLRYGDKVLAEMNKYEVIRHALNQITHHRAQLGVYLRLLDVPIPGTYGPSADDQSFQ